MSQGDLSSDRGGQSPATSDFASAFATGLVLGGGRDDDDDVYFGDEEETEFTNGLGGTSCNDSDDEEGLLTGGGGGGDDDSDDDMFSKTYTSDRGSTFERHDSMQSAQSEAVKQYAEEKGLGSEKTSFRAALLKKRQTRHNANASTNSGTASPGGLNNSISAGAAFNRLREQQQLQAHQQQIHQLRHGGVAGGIDGVHAAALLGASGGGGDIHRVCSLSGASNASSNTSSRLAVTSGLSPYSTPGSHQRHHLNTSSQNGTVPYHHHKHNQSFPTHPATLLHHNHQHHHNNTLSNPASGAASNSTTPASISPRQDVVLPGTPLTLISTADGASPRGGGTHHGGPMTAIIDSQNVGGFRVAVAAMAGPGEDSESDEEATMVDALTTPLIDNNMGMIADLLRREGAPPILQATTTAATTPTMEATLTTMGVQDRHLNFRSCAFEGEEYDAFYNHHQSCLRDGGIAPAYKPLSLSRVSSNLPTPDMSHHHLSSGSSPSPNSDPHLFGNAQVLPGVVALQLSSPDPNAHHHIRTSSQDNQTRGNELIQSTMQCPPTTSFPPNSTVVVGCTLKQLRRVQGPLHYTPLFAALFAVGSGGGVAPRGTVVRHTGDYTLVRFKNLPTVNVAPISTHSHLHLSGSINGSSTSTLVHPQRGLWPHIDSTYHPLNTVLTPQQRSELMDNLDEDMLLDRTHSVHIDHSSTLVGGENGTDSPPHHHPNHHHSSSTNKYPAMLSVEQQHAFMEAWSTNRDQRQRLRSEIIKRSAGATTSNHDDDAGSSVTCEFTIHRSCLSLLSSA